MNSTGHPPADETEFVQKEIDRFLDLWKHADARVGAGYTLLVGIVAVAASVLGIYAKSAAGNQTLAASAPVMFGFATVMVIISVRMIATEITKTEYLTAINMLRWYASGSNYDLQRAMFIPPVIPPLGLSDHPESALDSWFNSQLQFRFPLISRALLHSTIGVAYGYSIGAIVWLQEDPLKSISFTHGIAVVVGVVVALVTSCGHHLLIRRYQIQRVSYTRTRFASWLSDIAGANLGNLRDPIGRGEKSSG